MSYSSCIMSRYDSCTVLFKCPQKKIFPPPPPRWGWGWESATQLQPTKSICYIGYTSKLLDMHSCALKQEASTLNLFYDGISFQYLATVLISVFMQCYRPGLLFRYPPCIWKNPFSRPISRWYISSAVMFTLITRNLVDWTKQYSCKEKPTWCTIYLQYISSDLYMFRACRWLSAVLQGQQTVI